MAPTVPYRRVESRDWRRRGQQFLDLDERTLSRGTLGEPRRSSIWRQHVWIAMLVKTAYFSRSFGIIPGARRDLHHSRPDGVIDHRSRQDRAAIVKDADDVAGPNI